MGGNFGDAAISVRRVKPLIERLPWAISTALAIGGVSNFCNSRNNSRGVIAVSSKLEVHTKAYGTASLSSTPRSCLGDEVQRKFRAAVMAAVVNCGSAALAAPCWLVFVSAVSLERLANPMRICNGG